MLDRSIDECWCMQPGVLCGACRYRRVTDARERLRILAANLATAAALCAAHVIGKFYGDDPDARYVGWEPGRGKPAPGMDRESGGGDGR